MKHLSRRIKNMTPSQTIAMSAKARELRNQGKDIIALSIGEPDFDTPEFIKEEAKNALNQGFTSYTPVAGFEELKKAICNKFYRDNSLKYIPDQIVVSSGAKHSIMNVCLCLIESGDQAIIPAPYWVSYKEMIKLAEGIPIVIETSLKNEFKITPKELENAITERTKLFIFSSPCNPSGSVYTKEELASLVKVFEKYPNIFIVSDEIYEYISYGEYPYSIARFKSMYDRVITVNGLSKGYAMTGWRIGYIGAPLWLANACIKLQSQFTSGVNSIAQRAAILALSFGREKYRHLIEAFEKRKNMVFELTKKIPHFKVQEPKGAFYVFPDVSYYFGKTLGNRYIKNSNDFCIYLLERAEVATVSGEAFGYPSCIRISYAASEEKLTIAFNRIRKVLTTDIN